ncbi:MAG: hypothetical protein PHW15_03085 [Patescibacteria group bacterium]|nr:hypothetical protein [Patescibacteria group bacterium]
MDTLKNESISRKIRGGNFISHKLRALQNLKKLQISTNIIQVIIKNLNEGEMQSVLNFSRKNKFITRHRMLSYEHLGRTYFSKDQEFLTDELVETVAAHFPKLFSFEEVHYFQKLFYVLAVLKKIPICYLYRNLFIPRNGYCKILDFEKLPKILDKFKVIWRENKKLAEVYLFTNLKLMMGKYFLILENNFHNQFCAKNFLDVAMGRSSNLFDFDEKETNQRCLSAAFNLGSDSNISRCEENIRLHAVSSKGEVS